ncbi:MAG: hypothetical protein LBT22_05035 [Peptococcaceae bacterium]|jgi:hypothetical protein|nr:hypothetical protein [Peptococcaceae bacterium]
MSFSQETQRKMDQFAREQSRRYLEAAEMTYLEKLREKSGRSKRKIGAKLARFKGTSDKGLEAQNDMTLYMSDFMQDLISQGISEQDAFARAREALSADESEQAADLHARFRQYYQNRDPADYEAVGLLYGGFLFIGLAVGALIGFLASGGVPAFLKSGWIYTLAGIAAGAMIGIGLGLLSNALIVTLKRK